MPKFTYEDTQTGKTLTLDRETEPSESELTQLFSSQQPAAKPAEQSVAQPAAMPDSAMQFLGKPQGQAPVPVASLEVMSGGFPAAPKAALPPRPTQTDAIRKAVELSMGGALGLPTVSQITQIYFNMQNEYERAIKPVDKSERDKAFEIAHNRFTFENKRLPNPVEIDELYKKAATAGTREFSDGGIMIDEKGEFAGHAFTDGSGNVMVRQQDGLLRKMRPGDIPTTAGALNKGIMLMPDFLKLNREILDDESALRGLKKYSDIMGGIPQGIERAALDFTTSVKTLMSDPLNAKEISLQIAKGNLQGLVGRLRTTVAGPGATTEGDVQRIVSYLGGNVNALQNPQVVKNAIADIFGEKLIRYRDNLTTYNYAVDSYWGRKGSNGAVFYKPKKEIEIDLDNKLIDGKIGVFGVPKTVQDIRDQLNALKAEEAAESSRKK
jgi:hypothetical protein